MQHGTGRDEWDRNAQQGRTKERNVRTRLAIKTHALLEHFFPERRVFLKSDTDTRFIRLRPSTQLAVFAGSAALVAWAIIATAVILIGVAVGKEKFAADAKEVTDCPIQTQSRDPRSHTPDLTPRIPPIRR